MSLNRPMNNLPANSERQYKIDLEVAQKLSISSYAEERSVLIATNPRQPTRPPTRPPTTTTRPTANKRFEVPANKDISNVVASSLFSCNTGTKYMFRMRDHQNYITEFCAIKYADDSWTINNTYIIGPTSINRLSSIIKSGDFSSFDGAKCFFISLWEHNYGALQNIGIVSPYNILQLSGHNIIHNFRNKMIYLDDNLMPLLRAIQFKNQGLQFVSIICNIIDDTINKDNFITNVNFGSSASSSKLQLSVTYNSYHYVNSADYCNINLWRENSTIINV